MSGWDGPVASRSLAVRNTHALAKAGFITIRNLLEGRVEGGSAAALALAEALHNLPEPGTRSCKSSRWIGCRSSPRAIRTWRSCSIPPPQSRSRQHEGGDATAHRAPDCAQGRQGLDRGGLQGGRVRRRGNRLRGQHGRARDHGRHVQHRRGLSVCHDARRGREDEAGRMGALHLRQYGFRRHQRLHHEP